MTDQHKLAREIFFKQRTAKRQRMSLGRRIDVALSEARTLSEVPSPTLERQARNAESEQVGPGRATGLLLSPDKGSAHDVFRRRLTVLVRALESEVDCHRFGLSVAGVDSDAQTTEERDKRLLRWTAEGLTAEEIGLLDPGQGSVLTIRRALERLNKDA